jgi:hypothetical protein
LIEEPIGGSEMRLTHRHRNQRRRAPQIAISQEEIAADLHYPARARDARRGSEGGRKVTAR